MLIFQVPTDVHTLEFIEESISHHLMETTLTTARLVKDESCIFAIGMMIKSACWSDTVDDNPHSLDSISDN